MINEELAKEIGNVLDLDKDFTAKGIGAKPTTLSSSIATVTSDIDALKRKLDTIAKGIHMLRDQL